MGKALLCWGFDSLYDGVESHYVGLYFYTKQWYALVIPDRKGEIYMETEPTIYHMNQMLRELSEGPFRAAYMVIEELYILQTGGKESG
jgi:hypothetical protein